VSNADIFGASAQIHQLHELDYYYDYQAVLTAMQRCNLTLDGLRQRGTFAISIGVQLRPPTQPLAYIKTDPSRVVEVFRTPTPTWDSPEGTTVYNHEAIVLRFNHFFKCSINDCCLNTVMSIAVLTCAYGIQHDRMTPQLKHKLLPPARLLYELCIQGKLSDLNPKHLASIRDTLAKGLASCPPEQFPTMLSLAAPTGYTTGRFQELHNVFHALLRGLPQFSFTTIAASSCCDRKFHVQPNRRPEVRSDIWIPLDPAKADVGEAVSTFFIRSKPSFRGLVCTRPKGQCSGEIVRANVVLDTLPPRLWLKTPAEKPRGASVSGAERSWRFDVPITIKHYNKRHQLDNTIYVPEMCVLWLGDHFILRCRQRLVNGKFRLLEWDHHFEDRVVEIKSGDWLHGRKHAIIYMVCYRVQSTKVGCLGATIAT
jgi:hypothetical protein